MFLNEVLIHLTWISEEDIGYKLAGYLLKVVPKPQVTHVARAQPGFCSMKQL